MDRSGGVRSRWGKFAWESRPKYLDRRGAWDHAGCAGSDDRTAWADIREVSRWRIVVRGRNMRDNLSVASSVHPQAPDASVSGAHFGPFLLVDRIAVGGMAEVFLAEEPQPAGEPRRVVIKRLLPALLYDKEARAMFAQERQVHARLEHEHVVRLLGSGEVDGHPYLSLEYVRGLDMWQLSRWLSREERTLSVTQAVYIVRAVCAGLHAVHEVRDEAGTPLEIVHRDVSPSNILLSLHGDVKLADLGICQRAGVMPGNSTAGERSKGKLGYLAPEQVRGAPCDRRADVFSTAVVMAELLMNKPLFAGGSELAVLLAIRDGDTRLFGELMPHLPAGLGETVLAALRPQPADRTPSADAFRTALAPFQAASDSTVAQEIGRLMQEAQRETSTGEITGSFSTPAFPTHEPAAFDEEAGTIREQLKNIVHSAKTADQPVLHYFVRSHDGSVRGPLTYAAVVQLAATGGVTHLDEVRCGDEPYQVIADVRELARHLTSQNSATTVRPDAPLAGAQVFNIEHGGLVRALALACLRAEKGLLLCEQGDRRKEVYLRNGTPEFVTSNVPSELLGEYLVTQGAVTREELGMALAVMPRYAGRLGDTLVALGLVKPVQLFQYITSQVLDKLLDLFLWTKGTAQLFDGVDPPESGFPLGLNPWNILDEGIQRRLDSGVDAIDAETALHKRLVKSPDCPSELVNHPIPAPLRILMTLLEQPRNLGQLFELLDEPGGDSNRVLRNVILLLHMGGIAWVD